MTGSLGIEGGQAVTSDVLALIDFYVDNGIIEKDDDGNDVYPVTAKQIGTEEQVRDEEGGFACGYGFFCEGGG